jgi:uncharacterized protein YifE (UPF0438 family)
MSAVKLNKKEWALIERHINFYVELENGDRTPSTPAQERFVDVCKGKRAPRTEHELAFRKWKFFQAEKQFLESEAERKLPDSEKGPKPQAFSSPMMSESTNTPAKLSTKAAYTKAPTEASPINMENEGERPLRSNEIVWPKKYDEDFWTLPEHEDGHPRTEFGTREEHQMMRGRQRHATKRGRHR